MTPSALSTSSQNGERTSVDLSRLFRKTHNPTPSGQCLPESSTACKEFGAFLLHLLITTIEQFNGCCYVRNVVAKFVVELQSRLLSCLLLAEA